MGQLYFPLFHLFAFLSMIFMKKNQGWDKKQVNSEKQCANFAEKRKYL